MSLPKPRQVIIGILVLFAIYAVIKTPVVAADHLMTFLGGVVGAVRSIFTFFDALLNR